MIIFIYGEDTFRSRKYLHEQAKKFKQARDPQGFNVIFLDGKKEKIGNVLGEIVAAPFLAEKRMIVVENLLSISDKEALEEVIQRIKNNKIPETNVVVFWQGEAIGKTKEAKELFLVLGKEKYAQKFDKLSGTQLALWLDKEVSERGGVFEKGVSQYLAEQIKDIWFLNSLIDQLVAFKKETPISLKDVAFFITQKMDEDIFKLVEAVLNRNTAQAFELLTYQRQKGLEEQELFGLLIWNFRVLLELRDLFDREESLSSDAMAKELGLHPYVVKKNFACMKRFSLAQLKEIYQELLTIDVKTKTGFANQSLLNDLFMACL